MVSVLDKDNCGKLIIPSSITRVRKINQVYIFGVLKKCKFTEIYVDNKPNIPFDASYLCSGMLSEHIKLVFKHPECMVSTKGLFKLCTNLRQVDISNLKNNSITDMSEMLQACKSMKSIDMRHISMLKVKSINNMFSWCESLVNVELTTEGMPMLRYMDETFSNCNKIKNIRLDWLKDSKRLSSMDLTFGYCKSLENIDMSMVNTSSLISMRYILSGCILLKEVDLSRLDLSKVKICQMHFMGVKA